MSFVLRCLFWLGLAFCQIAEREGASLAGLTEPARQEIAAGAGEVGRKAVGAALEGAMASCRDNASVCLALATQAAQLQAGADRTAPERGSAAGRAALGHDTLRDGDRAPAWRLRRPNGGA